MPMSAYKNRFNLNAYSFLARPSFEMDTIPSLVEETSSSGAAPIIYKKFLLGDIDEENVDLPFKLYADLLPGKYIGLEIRNTPQTFKFGSGRAHKSGYYRYSTLMYSETEKRFFYLIPCKYVLKDELLYLSVLSENKNVMILEKPAQPRSKPIWTKDSISKYFNHLNKFKFFPYREYDEENLGSIKELIEESRENYLAEVCNLHSTKRKREEEEEEEEKEEVNGTSKSVVQISQESLNFPLTPINPRVEYLRCNFPWEYILINLPEETVKTDILDFSVWNGLESLLSPNYNISQFSGEKFLWSHREHLLGSDVFIGPSGIVSFLEEPLHFGYVIAYYGFKKEDNRLLEKLWERGIERLQKIFIEMATSKSSIQLLNSDLKANRDLFLSRDLSLYERMIVLASSWLRLHLFVYYTTRKVENNYNEIKDDYSVINIINNTENLWWLTCFDKNIKERINDFNHVKLQRKIDTIERILTEKKAKYFNLFTLSTTDDDNDAFRFRQILSIEGEDIVSYIQKDIKLLINENFAQLDEILNLRESILRGNAAATTTPALGSIGFLSRTQREIRIADANQYCFFPDDGRCVVDIHLKGLRSKHIENYSFQLEGDFKFVLASEEKESELKILTNHTDIFPEEYENNDPESFEDNEYYSDDDEILGYTAKDLGVSLREMKAEKNILLDDFYRLEVLGMGLGEELASYRETMLIEELTRLIPNTNRGLVEFVASRYNPEKIIRERKIEYDYSIPLKVCRLTKLPTGSKIGIHSNFTPGGYCKLNPAPHHIFTCLVVMAYLGYDKARPEKDFITLAKRSAFNKTGYARVTFIPPTRVTELKSEENLKNSFSQILAYVMNRYKSSESFIEDTEKILKAILRPKKTLINFILRRMSTAGFKKYALLKNVWQIIRKNAFIVNRVMNVSFKKYLK